MAEPTEVQALSKISTEIDESQINVLLSSQCIKAQAFLLDKLRKQSERYKEVCGFISSANLKLECEIKQAELEIHSLRNAVDTIKHANVELKKEYLLAKESKYEMAERIDAGEKKYEQLWLESKSRYESIPFVKNLLQAQNKLQTVYGNIARYENQTKSLAKEIEIRRDAFIILDQKHIVELATFVVHDVPRNIQFIQEKLEKINDLRKEIDGIQNEFKANNSTLSNTDKEAMENKTEVSSVEKSDAIIEDDWMPKFDETNIDLDFISDKLEKIKKVDMYYTQTEEATASSSNEKDNRQAKKYDWNVLNMDPYISPFFNNKMDDTKNGTRFNKLINILDDVSIGKRDAYNILSKVNPQTLQEVNKIDTKYETLSTLKRNAKERAESDVVASCNDNIVVPPTQFLDSSQDNRFTNSQLDEGAEQITACEINADIQSLKSSQEGKKQVSFHLSTSMEISESPEKLEECLDHDTGPVINNTLDTSAVSDEDFVKIKDIVLKKHNLESSPQFVYAKNNIPSKTMSANIVKSKYFEHKDDNMESDNEVVDDENKVAADGCSQIKSIEENPNNIENKLNTEEQKECQNKIEAMEVDNAVVTNVKINESQRSNVTGLLFTHGGNSIPESLNMSISTSGYDDGDSDFPHYIDSNLLLSPKADIQMGDDNPEVKSQEVPNFLSGLRKTGLSLFGNLPSSTNVGNNNQNQNSGNSFKFSFGGDEKKSRGGFFNMFN